MITPASLDAILYLIWIIALALVLAGLLVMVLLIFRRMLEERAAARLEPARKMARRGLLAWLECGSIPPADLVSLTRLPLEELAQSFNETAQIVRGEARSRLADLAREVGVDWYLRKQLGARRAALRIQAARRLEQFTDPTNRRALTTALQDHSAQVRLTCAESLLSAGDDPKPLLERMLSDPATGTRAAGAFFFRAAQLHPKELANRLDPDDTSLRQLLIIKALAEAASMEAWPMLRVMRGSPKPALREASLMALARLGHPQLSIEVEAALRDTAPSLRRSALRLCGAQGVRVPVHAIEALADDVDPVIQRLARELLPEGADTRYERA